jgi:hypothetical protein
MTRLELGRPAALAPLGRLAGGTLGRPAYLALARAGLAGLDQLADAEDDKILEAAAGDTRILRAVRAALLKRGQESVPLEIPLFDASLSRIHRSLGRPASLRAENGHPVG